MINYYLCKHCGKVLKRESTNKYINSFCDEISRSVRPARIEKADYSKYERAIKEAI